MHKQPIQLLVLTLMQLKQLQAVELAEKATTILTVKFLWTGGHLLMIKCNVH